MSFPTKKAQQLKKHFHSTRKGDDETIESYVKRLKSITDSVAAIDSPISDSDMVLQLVAGLPSEYEPVKKIISSKWPLPTFEEACSMVYVQEGILLQVKISFPTEEDDNSNKNEKNPIQDDQIKRVQLRMQFHSTGKGDDETIESYVKRLKSMADPLAATDSPISDSDMVLQLLAGLPSEYEPLKKIISSRRPLPTFEDACSMVSMQERKFLQDHPEEQNTTDPRVVGEEESSAFTTLEKVVTAVGNAAGAVSTVAGAVGAVGAVAGALPTVAGAVGAVGASRMIVGCAVGALGAVASWKVWQSQKKIRI